MYIAVLALQLYKHTYRFSLILPPGILDKHTWVYKEVTCCDHFWQKHFFCPYLSSAARRATLILMALPMGPAQRATVSLPHQTARLQNLSIWQSTEWIRQGYATQQHKKVWTVTMNMHILTMRTVSSEERRPHEAQLSHLCCSPLYMPTLGPFDIKQIGKYRTPTTVDNLVSLHLMWMALKLSLLDGSSEN